MRALLQLARRLPARQRPSSNSSATTNVSTFLWRPIAVAATPRLVRSRFSTFTLRRGATAAAAAAAVDSIDVLESDRSVQIQWEDGRTSHYDFTWLRVNCPSCLHESGQRTVFPGDVGADLKPTAVRGETDGSRVGRIYVKVVLCIVFLFFYYYNCSTGVFTYLVLGVFTTAVQGRCRPFWRYVFRR